MQRPSEMFLTNYIYIVKKLMSERFFRLLKKYGSKVYNKDQIISKGLLEFSFTPKNEIKYFHISAILKEVKINTPIKATLLQRRSFSIFFPLMFNLI